MVKKVAYAVGNGFSCNLINFTCLLPIAIKYFILSSHGGNAWIRPEIVRKITTICFNSQSKI